MIRVILTPAFNHAVKQLYKRYPHILDDVAPLMAQLENGDMPGDKIQGLPYRVYKARVKNSDDRRGKSGGYRTIYYVETPDEIAVITIYSKSDQTDIPPDVIRRIIEDYTTSNP